MSARRRGRALGALALAATLALAACGKDGPSGPGSLEGNVSAATPLGAVVVQVEGSGIAAISGAGDTRVFEGPTTGQSRRLILVGSGSGELDFEIDVEDLASPRPSVTVVSATDTFNEEIAAVSTIDVKLSTR